MKKANRLTHKSPTKGIIISLIIGAHIAIPVGGVIALEIGRTRFFGLLLYAVAALFIFDILFIVSDPLKKADLTKEDLSENIRIFINFRIIIIFLLAMIIAFALFGRGWVAYLSGSLTGTALVFRIKHRGNINVSLFVLFMGFILMIFSLSQSFTVPYLAQTFDTIKHTELVKSIIETGRTSQLQTTRYGEFLIFHILAASVVQLISTSVRTSVALSFAILFAASLFATYAFLTRREIDQKKVLFAIVIFAFSPTILSWSTKVHYQSLSFVYFTFVLFILECEVKKYQRLILSVLIFTVWVNTHHLSLFMSVVLLSPFALTNIWDFSGNNQNKSYIYLILYIILGAKWSIVTSWFTTPIAWITQNSPQTGKNIGTSGLLVNVYDSIDGIFISAIPFFVDYLHLSLLLALSSTAIISFFTAHQQYSALLAGAIIGSIFYFPNPLWIPLRGLAALLRWQIMVQPFIIVLSGAGLLAFLRKSNTSRWFQYIGSVCFVLLLLFLMISAGFFAPTTSDFVGSDRYDRQYLSNQDLTTSEWVTMYSSNDESVYATSKLLGYISSTDLINKENQREYIRARVTGVPGKVIFPEGLTVFQRNAFRTEAIKVAVTPSLEYYSSGGRIATPVSTTQISYTPELANTVYTNGNTVIHEST